MFCGRIAIFQTSESMGEGVDGLSALPSKLTVVREAPEFGSDLGTHQGGSFEKDIVVISQHLL